MQCCIHITIQHPKPQISVSLLLPKGACPTGAGPSPKEDPANPWPGTCGSGLLKGKGPNTFTSGFEGPWTEDPTQWDNEYFKNLLRYDWQVHTGPGGHNQWRPVLKAGDTRKSAPKIMMLTADVALLEDPSYLKLVKLYAANQTALDIAFRDGEWVLLLGRFGMWSSDVGRLSCWV